MATTNNEYWPSYVNKAGKQKQKFFRDPAQDYPVRGHSKIKQEYSQLAICTYGASLTQIKPLDMLRLVMHTINSLSYIILYISYYF